MVWAPEPTPERAPLVLVSQSHLPEAAFSLALEAGRRVGASSLPWSAREEIDASVPPSLLVAGLAAGARRVPEDVTQLLTNRFPRLPLLLLCDEPLLRPTMTTQGGRVVLLAPPLSAASVAARIRMLLASAEEDFPSNLGHAADFSPGLATRELRRPHYWAGAFGWHRETGPPVPALRQEPSTGLTVILSESLLDRRPLESVVGLLRGKERDEQKEAALAHLLGDRRAAVHLAPGAEQWVI
jgi:hypothetical protein